jgi:hypothetical protein
VAALAVDLDQDRHGYVTCAIATLYAMGLVMNCSGEVSLLQA